MHSASGRMLHASGVCSRASRREADRHQNLLKPGFVTQRIKGRLGFKPDEEARMSLRSRRLERSKSLFFLTEPHEHYSHMIRRHVVFPGHCVQLRKDAHRLRGLSRERIRVSEFSQDIWPIMRKFSRFFVLGY